ncbi:MAG: NAD(P)H-hydrate dehydratase [Anaerolineales bacterium]|nr:NAD(P)H-hydrate dehydratase [Anaerolineales bacterium]
MPKLLTISEMQALERAADAAGVSYAQLMENAGRAVAEAVLERLGDDLDAHKIAVLCGKGNNGGDGLVAAHYLSNAGARVTVYGAQPFDEADIKIKRLREKSVFMADAAQDTAANDQRWRVLNHLLNSATVVIDAVFGTGARWPLGGPGAELLKEAAQILNARTPRPFTVAVDCPSGLNCDTGALDAATLPADLTVTFAAAKRGHFAFPGADALGELLIADIGIPTELLAQYQVELAEESAVRALLPPRPRNAHKGTFGKALIIAGSFNYTGAAYLAGASAYRIGAGLVTLSVPDEIHAFVAGQLPEATWLARDEVLAAVPNYTACLIGPGLGTGREASELLQKLLKGTHTAKMGFGGHVSESKPVATSLPPLVVDADALRLLAALPNWHQNLPPHSILTPHPGEMAALTGVDKAELQTDRVATALKYAQLWGQVVVLKGAFTVIAAPDGRATVLPVATAALARAGTGDVLAGMIVGLLAQGVAPYSAATTAAYLHARAGELAAQTHGQTASVLASDVVEALPQVLVATHEKAV